MGDVGLILFAVGGDWAITSRGLLRLRDARLFEPDELRRMLKDSSVLCLLGDHGTDPTSTVAAICAAAAVHEVRLWRQQVGFLLRHMAAEQAERQARREDELRAAIGAD